MNSACGRSAGSTTHELFDRTACNHEGMEEEYTARQIMYRSAKQRLKPESRMPSSTRSPSSGRTESDDQLRFMVKLVHKVIEVDGKTASQALGRCDILLFDDDRPLAIGNSIAQV